MKHACTWERLFSTFLVCILIVTFAVYGSLVSTAYSAEWSAPEKALSFLTDVIKLDETKYNVTLIRNNVDNHSEFWYGLPENSVKYNFESNQSKLHANIVFVNKTLWSVHIYVDEGSPLYAEPISTNLLERADAILERYQNYTASDCQEMRDILATVTEIENMTITVDNVRFELTKKSRSTKFRWEYTFNGADYTRIGFTFRHDGDFAFGDTRLLYKIGSTDVIVSREEAISIARERAKNLPWKVKKAYETIEVTDYKVVDEPVDAGLYTRCREPLVLYPYWIVTLYLDKVYPGNVYGFTFDIWADTGEIINGYLRTLMGGIPPEDSTDATTPPTETPSEPQIVIPTEPPNEENLTVTPTEPPPEDSASPPVEPLTVPPPDDSTEQTNPDLTLLLIAVPIVLAVILGIAFYRRKQL